MPTFRVNSIWEKTRLAAFVNVIRTLCPTNHYVCIRTNIQHIVSYPISQGRTINLVIFITIPDGEDTLLDGPAVVDATKEEVLEHYKGWEPEIQSLLNVRPLPVL